LTARVTCVIRGPSLCGKILPMAELFSDRMSVIQDAAWPCARVGKETDLRGGFRMILLPGLRDLRSVFFQQACGAMRGANDCDVAGAMWVDTLEDDHHQISAVGQRLGFVSIPRRLPSTLSGGRGTEPLRLCIGKQNLAVFRRPQHIYP